jgi:uncharacterized membrane protein (UPF0127 family)
MATANIFLQSAEFSNTTEPVLRLDVQDTFFKRFKGLMFATTLDPNGGALFINQNTNFVDSSIHMFFMNYDIAVFWLDQDYRIVDKILAKKWRPFYAPKKPAKMIIETHYNNLAKFKIGDQLKIEIH